MIPPVGNRKVMLLHKYLTPVTSEDQGTTVSPAVAVCVVMFMMMRTIIIAVVIIIITVIVWTQPR